MRAISGGLLLIPAAILGAASAQSPKEIGQLVDFGRDIRSLLSSKCFACHGPDAKHRMGGLTLETRAGATAKAASGRPAIVPGKPATSTLILRIRDKGPLLMPPASTGKPLSAAEKNLLERWIAQGAVYKRHWSFVRPLKATLPAVRQTSWARNPIDRFVLARLEAAGLAPSPEADRNTLVRRLSLDLTGLPPSLEEVESFVNDRLPHAYERLVDRLLASPHFGERWARPWLDLARYADSAGYGSDPLRPNLWPWRDWVISAFNRNLPYDRFTTEQIAGDLLPNPTLDQLVATGFHRNTMTNTEGGTDDEEFRTAAVKDRTITTVQAWMGLTMGCAQCHSHKFDPITQKEFYRFLAYFNQTEDFDQPDERPTIDFPTADFAQRKAALEAEVASLGASARSAEEKATLDKKRKELTDLRPLQLPVMRDLPAEKKRKTRVLVLANFLSPAEEVTEGMPDAFHRMPPEGPANRLGVASWIVSRQNPLTARVAVNRFWAQLYGMGIVETEEDFGLQGAFPSHRELLDWLAVDLMERGWDVKALIRTIVTSATYRQGSRASATARAKDPRNRLLSHYPRRRLDAETVRDQALAISGLLSRKIGGPSVYPPQPPGLWQAAFNGERTWPTSVGEDRYRRGLYTFWRRTVPYPSMATFDAPSREVCTIRRIPTNTPLQALVTLNDPAYLEMAQALGRRIVKQGGETLRERLSYGLRLATSRPANAAKVAALERLFVVERAKFAGDVNAGAKLATEPLGPLPQGLDAADAAAWTVVANVLLNLDGVLAKG